MFVTVPDPDKPEWIFFHLAQKIVCKRLTIQDSTSHLLQVRMKT